MINFWYYNIKCISLLFVDLEKRQEMEIKYNKLFDLMKQNQMKQKDLIRACEMSSSTASKIYKNQPVSIEVLMRICKVFHCDIGDICEIELDE